MTNTEVKKALKLYTDNAISANNNLSLSGIELDDGEIDACIRDIISAVFYAGRASLAIDLAKSCNGPDESAKKLADENCILSRHLTSRVFDVARSTMEAVRK